MRIWLPTGVLWRSLPSTYMASYGSPLAFSPFCVYGFLRVVCNTGRSITLMMLNVWLLLQGHAAWQQMDPDCVCTQKRSRLHRHFMFLACYTTTRSHPFAVFGCVLSLMANGMAMHASYYCLVWVNSRVVGGLGRIAGARRGPAMA